MLPRVRSPLLRLRSARASAPRTRDVSTPPVDRKAADGSIGRSQRVEGGHAHQVPQQVPKRQRDGAESHQLPAAAQAGWSIRVLRPQHNGSALDCGRAGISRDEAHLTGLRWGALVALAMRR